MSERERWIVYPLLFLALGFSIRPALFDVEFSNNVKCKTLVCDHLKVRGNGQLGSVSTTQVQVYDKNDLNTLVLIGADDRVDKDKERRTLQSGRIQIIGKEKRPVIVLNSGQDESSGSIATYEKDGVIANVITSGENGSELKMWYHDATRKWVMTAEHNKYPGLFISPFPVVNNTFFRITNNPFKKQPSTRFNFNPPLKDSNNKLPSEKPTLQTEQTKETAKP